jgi:hypothetical protein
MLIVTIFDKIMCRHHYIPAALANAANHSSSGIE